MLQKYNIIAKQKIIFVCNFYFIFLDFYISAFFITFAPSSKT